MMYRSYTELLIMIGPNKDWQNSGGSVVWNRGYWSLVFDMGGPDLPYTKSAEDITLVSSMPTPT